MNEILPDGNKPIQIGDPSFVYKNVYHPIIWLGADPYRPRVEMLTIKDRRYVFIRRYEKNDSDENYKYNYRIPGGSIDADSDKLQQAIAETNEEGLLAVKNAKFSGVSYYEQYQPGFLLKGGDMPIEYKGSMNDVFVAEYAGKYDKSKVEEKDLDNDMATKGKFYAIVSIAKDLKPEHIRALVYSGMVDSDIVMFLRRVSDSKGFPIEITSTDPISTVFNDNPVGIVHSFESTDIVVPGGKLYHGTTAMIDKFKPMSLDIGNINQKPGWSTFCFADYNLAKRFGLMRLIQSVTDKLDETRTDPKWKNLQCEWNVGTCRPFVDRQNFNPNLFIGEKFYVYTIAANRLKELGIGNDSKLPEYTFRDSDIAPDAVEPIEVTKTMLLEDVMIVDDFGDVKVANDKAITDGGWESSCRRAMLNRDYNEDSVVGKLEKAVQTGELKPGDDIEEFMNQKGWSFDESSFIGGMASMEASLTAKERKAIPDKEYGLPTKRKYPMPDKKHVRAAIRFFNYVDKEDEAELARNINKMAKKYGMIDEIKVGSDNRFSKYWKGEVTESIGLPKAVEVLAEHMGCDYTLVTEAGVYKRRAGESKDLAKARQFCADVRTLASKKNLPFFVVTNGASAYSNDGNDAIRHARDMHIEWEKTHGEDPDEDWSSQMESVAMEAYRPMGKLTKFKLVENPSKKFVEDHLDDADCIKDFLDDKVRRNSCMFIDTKTNKIACVFMVFNDRGHRIINNFEVTPKYRGQGLSEDLLDFAVKKKGANHLWVNDDNKIAKHVYTKYGFKPTGDTYKDGNCTRQYMALEASSMQSAGAGAVPFDVAKTIEDIISNDRMFISQAIWDNLDNIVYYDTEEVGNSTVGSVIVFKDHSSNVGHLMLSVDTSATGFGVANNLMDDLLRNWTNLGVNEIRVTVQEDYEEAIKLFTSYGFKEIFCEEGGARTFALNTDSNVHNGTRVEEELMHCYRENMFQKYHVSPFPTLLNQMDIVFYDTLDDSIQGLNIYWPKDNGLYYVFTKIDNQKVLPVGRIILRVDNWKFNGWYDCFKFDEESTSQYLSQISVSEVQGMRDEAIHLAQKVLRGEHDYGLITESADGSIWFNISTPDKIIMEAPGDDDDPGTPTDYTTSAPDETAGNTMTDDQPTDYTQGGTGDEPAGGDAEEEPTNPMAAPGGDDTADDAGAGGDAADMDDPGEEPTDYTDAGDDMGGGDMGEDTGGDTGTDATTSDSSNNNIVVKNYSLIKDFEKAYTLIDDINSTIDSTLKASSVQNQVLVQVSRNLSNVKDFIKSFVQFHFKDNDYSYNLYYYMIVIQFLKINLAMVEKITLLGD